MTQIQLVKDETSNQTEIDLSKTCIKASTESLFICMFILDGLFNDSQAAETMKHYSCQGKMVENRISWPYERN